MSIDGALAAYLRDMPTESMVNDRLLDDLMNRVAAIEEVLSARGARRVVLLHRLAREGEVKSPRSPRKMALRARARGAHLTHFLTSAGQRGAPESPN